MINYPTDTSTPTNALSDAYEHPLEHVITVKIFAI